MDCCVVGPHVVAFDFTDIPKRFLNFIAEIFEFLMA